MTREEYRDLEPTQRAIAYLEEALSPDWTETCPYAHDGEPLVPLIIGTGPAALHHVINASFTTRLYLLDLGSSNVVIEVVDHPGDDLGLKDYEAIIEELHFGS